MPRHAWTQVLGLDVDGGPVTPTFLVCELCGAETDVVSDDIVRLSARLEADLLGALHAECAEADGAPSVIVPIGGRDRLIRSTSGDAHSVCFSELSAEAQTQMLDWSRASRRTAYRTAP